MPDNTAPPVPEELAPSVVESFFSAYVVNAEKEYAQFLLGEQDDMELFDFQIETVIYGLHCLDRAVFARWGAEYRDQFMECAFEFACTMLNDALPAQEREEFLGEFMLQANTRHREYGAMRPWPREDKAMKGVLPWEFATRLCGPGGQACDPASQLALTQWASGVMVVMTKVLSDR